MRFRNEFNWSLRDNCVIELTWLVTGSFCKRLNASITALREICGIRSYRRKTLRQKSNALPPRLSGHDIQPIETVVGARALLRQ